LNTCGWFALLSYIPKRASTRKVSFSKQFYFANLILSKIYIFIQLQGFVVQSNQKSGWLKSVSKTPETSTYCITFAIQNEFHANQKTHSQYINLVESAQRLLGGRFGSRTSI
jgi:hypothetical protein